MSRWLVALVLGGILAAACDRGGDVERDDPSPTATSDADSAGSTTHDDSIDFLLAPGQRDAPPSTNSLPGDESLRQCGLQAEDLPPEFREAFHQDVSVVDLNALGGGQVQVVWSFTNPFRFLGDALVGGEFSEDAMYQRSMGRTQHVMATVMRADDAGGAATLAEKLQAQREEGATLLAVDAEYGEEFDETEALEDHRKTWAERERVTSALIEFGEHATMGRSSVAKLDYDPVTNAYRSDRELYRLNTEAYAFTMGRYVVMLSRTAVMSDASMPDDVDLEAIARVLYERVSAAP